MEYVRKQVSKKQLEHLASQTAVCSTPGQSCLQPMKMGLAKYACCDFCSQDFDFQEKGFLYLTLIHDLLAELELTYLLKFMDFMNVVDGK